MNEYLDNAKEDFKRIDHLIYVSLKYSRTVDIFMNIFQRMISCTDLLMDGLLQKLKEKGNIKDIPHAPRQRCDLLKTQYPEDAHLAEFLDHYLLIRRLSKSNFTRSNEFRRHVTMTATLDTGETLKVDIDRIHEYYDKLKDFIEYMSPRFDD